MIATSRPGSLDLPAGPSALPALENVLSQAKGMYDRLP